MDPLDLKSGDYDGTYKLIGGGEVSLDFVNTVSWAGSTQEHDWLDCPENFTAWAQAAGIIDKQVSNYLETQDDAFLRKELTHVQDIRSNLTNLLRPIAHERKPTLSAIKKFNKLIRKSSEYRHIDADSYCWAWDNPETLTQVLNPVIWNAAHVLTDLDHSRISHCPSCHWIFYDTTRNRSRKWCDMKDCGSRNKALRYYHRSKSTDDSELKTG